MRCQARHIAEGLKQMSHAEPAERAEKIKNHLIISLLSLLSRATLSLSKGSGREMNLEP